MGNGSGNCCDSRPSGHVARPVKSSTSKYRVGRRPSSWPGDWTQLVIHDGEPVYRTRAESDWNLSQERLSRMERSGITPIGVYIGPESGCSRLKLLFRRLVVCEGRELPEKLGSLLQSLA
jgi:hypothetical protein